MEVCPRILQGFFFGEFSEKTPPKKTRKETQRNHRTRTLFWKEPRHQCDCNFVMSQNMTVVVVCETAVCSPSCEESLVPCLYTYIVEEFKSVSNCLAQLARFQTRFWRFREIFHLSETHQFHFRWVILCNMKNSQKKMVKNLIRDPPNFKTPSSTGDVLTDHIQEVVTGSGRT